MSKTVTVKIGEPVYNMISAVAKHRGVPIEELLRIAVNDPLNYASMTEIERCMTGEGFWKLED